MGVLEYAPPLSPELEAKFQKWLKETRGNEVIEREGHRDASMELIPWGTTEGFYDFCKKEHIYVRVMRAMWYHRHTSQGEDFTDWWAQEEEEEEEPPDLGDVAEYIIRKHRRSLCNTGPERGGVKHVIYYRPRPEDEWREMTAKDVFRISSVDNEEDAKHVLNILSHMVTMRRWRDRIQKRARGEDGTLLPPPDEETAAHVESEPSYS